MKTKTKKKLLMWTLICLGVAIFCIFYTFVPAFSLTKSNDEIVSIRVSMTDLSNQKPSIREKTFQKGDNENLFKVVENMKFYRVSFLKSTKQNPDSLSGKALLIGSLKIEIRDVKTGGQSFYLVSMDKSNSICYFAPDSSDCAISAHGSYVTNPYVSQQSSDQFFDLLFDLVKNETSKDFFEKVGE